MPLPFPPPPAPRPCLQERANLAEQTLQQKTALLVEKQRFQADVQHFSQDLQKLAKETSSKLDGKLAEQVAGVQAELFEEKKRRTDAEGEAQVGPDMCCLSKQARRAGVPSVTLCLA